MLTSSRTPQDHFLSAGLNNFFTSKNIKSSLKAGTMSYLAISVSNQIARKEYKNALILGAGAVMINEFLGEKNMKNPYLNNYENYNNYDYNMNNFSQRNYRNCPYNPYLNENNYQNNQNNQNNFLNKLTNQGSGILGSPLVKGILIGAAITYLLSNKDAKDTLAKGVAKLQSLASAAVEEFKEQIEDAKASMQE